MHFDGVRDPSKGNRELYTAALGGTTATESPERHDGPNPLYFRVKPQPQRDLSQVANAGRQDSGRAVYRGTILGHIICVLDNPRSPDGPMSAILWFVFL